MDRQPRPAPRRVLGEPALCRHARVGASDQPRRHVPRVRRDWLRPDPRSGAAQPRQARAAGPARALARVAVGRHLAGAGALRGRPADAVSRRRARRQQLRGRRRGRSPRLAADGARLLGPRPRLCARDRLEQRGSPRPRARAAGRVPRAARRARCPLAAELRARVAALPPEHDLGPGDRLVDHAATELRRADHPCQHRQDGSGDARPRHPRRARRR